MALMKCPDCGKEISEKAKKCPFCGSPLENERLTTCPACGHAVSKKATACPNCGQPLEYAPKVKIEFLKLDGIGKRSCIILDKNGFILAKCNHGETVELAICSTVEVMIRIDFPIGHLSLRTELEPKANYQVKLNSPWSWSRKIVIVKKAGNE